LSRTFTSFSVTDFNTFKSQVLNWADQFNICCFLDNHHYSISPHTYECLLGVGAKDYVQLSAGNAFNELKRFSDKYPDWLFGHLGYDLKNETEDLHSGLPDKVQFPDLFFFVPEIIIRIDQAKIAISGTGADATNIFNAITATRPSRLGIQAAIHIRQRFSKSEYIKSIQALQKHILRGDCYEVNFCQEFFAEDVLLDPLTAYENLVAISPNPFAVYYKLMDHYLMCASPERYLKKTGKQLLSQPIKGTSGRNENVEMDMQSKKKLMVSPKDRSENVMIVDLVRNDLSRVCRKGSVRVDELFGVYPFPQVYQMISTITGEIREKLHWVDAVRQTFPMGSMTGAPKKKVMELIETYEQTKRGIFSGAVGYVTPERDFDFNVVIRSIMYNRREKYLSYLAGSGITFYSDPEKEYHECLLKVAAIKKVLTV
jgi:para-aminobenzoate synthetase component 1